jgi:hypothetical protein
MVINKMDNQVNPEALGLPARFTPSWPPRGNEKQMPNIFTRCSNTFKKVSWPPQRDEDEKDIAPPPDVQLLDQIPINDDAMYQINDTYKASPTVYAEEPEVMEESWPPPEPMNTDERVIYDPDRKKKVIRDYTVFFDKNKAPPTERSYKVPPGTLHVISQRGVLQYNTPELGSGRPMDSN